MRKLIAIVLFALPGCANLSGDWDNWIESQGDAARTLQRMFQGTEHAPARKDRTDAEVEQELEEMRAQWAREDEARIRQQAEDEEARKRRQAELEQRKEAAETRMRERTEADEARGYKHTTFKDFYLDFRSLPIGSKRAVRGLYQVFGEYETLTEVPSDAPFDGTPRVPVLTAGAPREVRARLLEPVCRVAFCPIVALGRTVECTIHRGSSSRNDVCFAIDELW